MRLLLTACSFLLISLVNAQNPQTLFGNLQSGDEVLSFSTVILTKASDSSIVQFSSTNEEGDFSFSKLKEDQYRLQFIRIGYITTYRTVDWKGESINLGIIQMEMENNRLNEVKVEGEVTPIEIKEDTIEYNSAAFTTRPDANVEDLLKKLPGVEVDKDGKVTAQGEEVKKVLVDGKEFFGNDPKVATKNLPADAVDAVQVFDKKSDMSEFSGIDDGERTKTINLVLKEGKKHGYFGKAEAGYGYPDDRAKVNLGINRFTKSQQLSALAMGNNINDQGFSIMDYANFMGGFRNLMQSGLASFQNGRTSVGPAANTSGVNEVLAGGINFNNEFSKKVDLQSSYFISGIDNVKSTESSRIFFDNENNFNSSSNSDETSESFNHKLNYQLNVEIDSIQNFRLSGNANYSNGNLQSALGQNSFLIQGQNLNTSVISNYGTGYELGTENNLLYRKKLKKSGRLFVAQVGLSTDREDRDIELESIIGQRGTVDSFDQEQDYYFETVSAWGKLSYTEPLGKGKYLELYFRHLDRHTDMSKDFYDKDPLANEGRTFNSLLSNAYSNVFRYERGGANFKISRDKYNLTAGLGGQLTLLDGSIPNVDAALEKNFAHLLGSARFHYRFSNSRRIMFNYSTNVNAPSIQQLQPVPDNSNPLMIYQGNPDLEAEYQHSANLRFMSFSQFSFTSVFAMLRATYTQNKISEMVSINEGLSQYRTPVNVDNDLNVSSVIHYSTPIRPLHIKISSNHFTSYNRSLIFINELQNTSHRFTQGVGLKVDNRKKDLVDVGVEAKLSNTSTTYSENEELAQDYVNLNYNAYVDWFLGELTTISSSIDITTFQGQAFENVEVVPLWKASVSRIFLKSKKAKIELSAFDLMNSNRGIDRTSTFNYIDESITNTVTRYYMMSLSYSLSGFGADKGKNKIMLSH